MSYESPELSIIIPTLNEERYISKLLDVLKKQTFSDYEVIVVDSDSKDKTCIIAEKYGVKVLHIARKGPGHGRNEGAKVANGHAILFIDADVLLPCNTFLERFMSEIKSKNLKLANCFHFLYPFKARDIPANIVMNLYFKAFSYINPIVPGFFIYIEKDLYDKTGGFDESIAIAEDSEFVRRAYRYSDFRMLNLYIFFSNRRFEHEGRLKLYVKYIYLNSRPILPAFLSNIKLDYKFGHYDEMSEEKKYLFLISKINQFFEKNRLYISEIYDTELLSFKKIKGLIIKKINKLISV